MTYEYICTACGHEWEADQPISAEPLKQCPVCSKRTAKRQISGGTGFLLKGSGWYADGYGSSKGTSAKGESETTTSSKSSETKSESSSDSSSKSETTDSKSTASDTASTNSTKSGSKAKAS